MDTKLVAPAGRRRGAGALPDEVFKLILDSTNTPFVVMDRVGTVVYAGGSIGRLLGWEPEEVVGRNMVEFLPDDQIDLALQAVAEMDVVPASDMGVPITFALLRPDGGRTWVEVGGTPLRGAPDAGLFALRLRAWDADHQLGEFLAALLVSSPTADVLPPLARSAAASLEGLAASIHHGWDGRTFTGVAGSWPGAAELPVAVGPWCDAMAHHDVVTEVAAPPLGPSGARRCWLSRIDGGDAAPPAILTVWREQDEPPLLGHRHALARVSRYVELALVRIAEHGRLAHLAAHDPLTGAANRSAFRERLVASLAARELGLALAFCDLDGFKGINDTYGHRTGDEVLVAVADRLRGALRTGDELARIGGDEFTVLLRGIADASTASVVGDRLLATLREPVSVSGGISVHVGLSVGIALAHPGADADGLLASADAALYACKRAGGRRSAIVG